MFLLSAAEISTMLDSATEDGRQKPKLEILMGKSAQFDQAVERLAKEQAEKDKGEVSSKAQ